MATGALPTRPLPPTRRGSLRRLLPVVLTVLAACGGDDPVASDPRVSALVGDWEATSLVLTNTLNPALSADLIEMGATFDLNVQPSGQYTAILVFQGQAQTEIGKVSVDGDRLTLEPTVPAAQPSTTGTYSIQGSVLTLDGATAFDFNSDGTAEPATVHMEFLGQP